MEQLNDRLNYIMRNLVDISNKLKDLEIFVVDTMPSKEAASSKPKEKPQVTLVNFPVDCYFQQTSLKSRIVIHHTAGTSVYGAIDHWKDTPEREGCAYIIARSGEIFEVFNPAYWAYHTGLGATFDKGSIGIELVNVGPVIKREDNDFYWWPGSSKYPKFGTKYPFSSTNIKCTDYTWRGYQCWELYTEEQYKSLASLLEWLCQEFKIPYTPDNIVGHSEIRAVKTDPSPVFDWRKLGLEK